MKVNYLDNQNFTSRCPQIKEAQNVCHKVASNFPHLSSTRFIPLRDKFENKYSTLYDEFINSNPTKTGHHKIYSNAERKVLAVFNAVKNLVADINTARSERIGYKDDLSKTYLLLSQLKYGRIGNCGEDAQLSELILRISGKKNVYTGSMKVGDCNIDHDVCFYNKDGSKFIGGIKKNTILVDSWLGEADFADNMLLKYKSIYKDYLFIPKDGKISFRNVQSLNLSETELNTLKKDFPELNR